MLETGSFYHYFGGLTTPPCTQAVYWNLADKPMKISVQQFATMSEIILKTRDPASDCEKVLTVASESGSTSRPPQPLGERTVKKMCPATSMVETDVGTDEPESSADISSFAVGALSFTAAVAAGQLL